MEDTESNAGSGSVVAVPSVSGAVAGDLGTPRRDGGSRKQRQAPARVAKKSAPSPGTPASVPEQSSTPTKRKSQPMAIDKMPPSKKRRLLASMKTAVASVASLKTQLAAAETMQLMKPGALQTIFKTLSDYMEAEASITDLVGEEELA